MITAPLPPAIGNSIGELVAARPVRAHPGTLGINKTREFSNAISGENYSPVDTGSLNVLQDQPRHQVGQRLARDLRCSLVLTNSGTEVDADMDLSPNSGRERIRMRPKAEHSMMPPTPSTPAATGRSERKRGHVDRRCGSQLGMIRAGRSLEHPGRNLQPAIHVRPAHRATENDTIDLLDRFMNDHLKLKPRVPRIQ